MTSPLSSRPADVADAAASLGAHVIDAGAIAPGVVRVTVSPGQVRLAVAALIQAGYEAAGSGAQGVLVTLPEPVEEIEEPAQAEPVAVYSDSGEFLGEIQADEHGARYWTAEEIAALRLAESEQRAEVARLVEFGLSPEEAQDEAADAAAEIAADDAAGKCGCCPDTLTPAAILAAATGHPSGAATRSAWPA